jgi:hypothetical protein
MLCGLMAIGIFPLKGNTENGCPTCITVGISCVFFVPLVVIAYSLEIR